MSSNLHSIIWQNGPDVPVEWHGRQTPCNAFNLQTGPETLLWDNLRAADPHHLALQDDHQALTYAEMLHQEDALAQSLMVHVPSVRPAGWYLSAGYRAHPIALLACLAAATSSRRSCYSPATKSTSSR
jgi:hypothetical protein